MRLVIAFGIALATTSAFAESKVDALFKQGKEQLAAKKYAEACATFEEVDKLEPGIGAKLNVDYVITGSIRSSGRSLRVAVELDDTASGMQVKVLS